MPSTFAGPAVNIVTLLLHDLADISNAPVLIRQVL